jgi:hypothetical protein
MAFILSLVYYIQVSLRVSQCKVLKYAERLGVWCILRLAPVLSLKINFWLSIVSLHVGRAISELSHVKWSKQ